MTLPAGVATPCIGRPTPYEVLIDGSDDSRRYAQALAEARAICGSGCPVRDLCLHVENAQAPWALAVTQGRRTRICDACGEPMAVKAKGSPGRQRSYCGEACRKRHQRQHSKRTDTHPGRT